MIRYLWDLKGDKIRIVTYYVVVECGKGICGVCKYISDDVFIPSPLSNKNSEFMRRSPIGLCGNQYSLLSAII